MTLPAVFEPGGRQDDKIDTRVLISQKHPPPPPQVWVGPVNMIHVISLYYMPKGKGFCMKVPSQVMLRKSKVKLAWVNLAS